MRLSVLMSVYSKDEPQYLTQSLESLRCQTMPVDEVIIVEDGPIGDPLRSVIEEYSSKLKIVSVKLAENSGLGYALSVGISHCTGELVARMDSDDICIPTRFEKQVEFMKARKEIDVVGSAIAEFVDDSTKIHAIRQLPEGGEELARFARKRNPLNHMTVMFRREKVLQAGSYQTAHGFEDYHLWARMLMMGCHLFNLKEALLLVRCGNGMQSRRGGLAYVRQEIQFQLYLRRMGFLTSMEYACNNLVRIPVRLLPSSLRGLIYRSLLRVRRT